MGLGLIEEDLESGLGIKSVGPEERGTSLDLVKGSLSRFFAGRLNQDASNIVRPLLQYGLENEVDQEHVIHLEMVPVKVTNKKINSKRPPKPPRPPKGPSLDAYDLKLIRELSALALERRMRIERMKDLKKMRASKAASSSSSNSTSVALVVTMLFFLIILFQGVCSNSGSATSLQNSPGPVQSPHGDEFISIQASKNLSPNYYDSGHSSLAQKSSSSALEDTPTRDAGGIIRGSNAFDSFNESSSLYRSQIVG